MTKLLSMKTDPIFTLVNSEYGADFFTKRMSIMREQFTTTGILVLPDFLSSSVIHQLQSEAAQLKEQAYFSNSTYNIYVLPSDLTRSAQSIRNRQFLSTKSCIADDQVPGRSFLRALYNSQVFRDFLQELVGTSTLYPYTDTLSCININYYAPGDSLEWHFDNADFAVTLLLKQCEVGGRYEYFKDIRYQPDGEENYSEIEKALAGKLIAQQVSVTPGSLMVFKGNKSLHRVTKVLAGERILVTLNYNSKPGVSLSEQSRKTFFGRLE